MIVKRIDGSWYVSFDYLWDVIDRRIDYHAANPEALNASEAVEYIKFEVGEEVTHAQHDESMKGR